MAFSRRTVALGGLLAALVLAAPIPSLADEIDLPGMLRAGGLVILLRHGPTNPNQADTDPAHPDNIAAQRNLNTTARRWPGVSARRSARSGLRSASVYTSQLNRAYETAVLAGFTVIEKTADLTETSTSMGKPADIEAGASCRPTRRIGAPTRLRKMLATEPDEGTNTIIITHKPNIIDALGEGFSDIREGEAAIFRPHNGSYRLIARVQMDEWPRLAAAK